MTRSTLRSGAQSSDPADGSQVSDVSPRLLQVGDPCHVTKKDDLGKPSIEVGILIRLPVLGGRWPGVNFGWLLDQDVDPFELHPTESEARQRFAHLMKIYRGKLRRYLAKAIATDPKTVAIRDKTAQASKRVKALMKGGTR